MRAARMLLVGLVVAAAFAPAAARAAVAVAAPAAEARAADTGDVAAAVRERLAAPAVLRGRFEQEKHLAGFRNPLRSRGTFLLVRERGVAWDTTEPFASSLVLDRDRIVATLPDGRRDVLLDATAAPATAAVNALLLALVAGDLDVLAPRFAMTGTLADDGGWTLRLVPRGAPLDRVFAHVDLAGDRFVREVRIAETGGDRSTIRFLDLAEAAAPTAAEAARLD